MYSSRDSKLQHAHPPAPFMPWRARTSAWSQTAFSSDWFPSFHLFTPPRLDRYNNPQTFPVANVSSKGGLGFFFLLFLCKSTMDRFPFSDVVQPTLSLIYLTQHIRSLWSPQRFLPSHCNLLSIIIFHFSKNLLYSQSSPHKHPTYKFGNIGKSPLILFLYLTCNLSPSVFNSFFF